MRRDHLIPEVPEWHKDAACSDYPAELWFPRQPEKAAAAIEVCAECPVKRECLDHALTNGIEHGTWGGLTPGGRRRLQREAR
jgi:WhiB family redox-sensing transcriptional regulator